MSTQSPEDSYWCTLMRSRVSPALEVLAGIGNRSCRRCHSAPSECRRELMALVLLHHTVKCCSNLSEAKMTAQSLINPFSTAPFPGGWHECVYVCAQGQVHDTGVSVNCGYNAVSCESFAGAVSFARSLVFGFSLVLSMNKRPLILYYFIKSVISDWLSWSIWHLLAKPLQTYLKNIRFYMHLHHTQEYDKPML